MIILLLQHLRKVSKSCCHYVQKTNILNRPLTSVFADDTKTSFPHLGPSPHPSMEHIAVSCEGVVKLLKKLKPHEAAGPDDIHPMLPTQSAEQIAPAIILFFQTNINNGSTPSTYIA